MNKLLEYFWKFPKLFNVWPTTAHPLYIHLSSHSTVCRCWIELWSNRAIIIISPIHFCYSLPTALLYPTLGPDHIVSLSIADESLPDPCKALSCNLFHGNVEGLPIPVGVGDVIRLHRVRVQQHDNRPQLVGNVSNRLLLLRNFSQWLGAHFHSQWFIFNMYNDT